MRQTLPPSTSLTLAAALPAILLCAGAAIAAPGLDLTGMDRKVDPGDDFFAYANGTWLATTEIPPDRSSWGAGSILADEADRRTAELIREAGASAPRSNAEATSDRRKIGDYFAAYMDEAAIEALGARPLAAELDAVSKLADKAALARFLGAQLRADVDPLNATNFQTDRLFGLWVSPDFDDTSRNAAYLLQGGIGMPSRENYLGKDERNVALQAKYRDQIAALLRLAGAGDPATAAARAERIYALERKIAETHVSRTDSLDVQKAHNRWLQPEFTRRAPGLDWEEYFTAAGLADLPALWVWHPTAVTGIARLVGSEPLELWKEYLTFRAIDRGAPLLSRAFVEQSFAFRGTALTGATQLRERWKRGVSATNGALGDAVGRLYVERYFSPEAKAAGERMVRDIIAAFGRRVEKLDWMSPATREQARAKLATLRVGIGYPDTWRDFTGLEVRRDDAFGNAARAELFDYRSALAKLGKPSDKGEWWMTPQTVNAVNLPLQNAMNFPAAILQPPFFDPQADAAQNYGGIGTVIGHEISHSFDDQGSLFDAQGRLANWWTAEDMARFQKLSERLVAQYDAYEPLPGARVNGKLTLSENIADVAGVAAAFDGYRAAVAADPGASSAAARQGFTTDQRFFISFAQIWRGKVREAAQRNALLTNGHSPGRYRAFTVRNLDAWYDAFGIQPGRGLYLEPKARVQLW